MLFWKTHISWYVILYASFGSLTQVPLGGETSPGDFNAPQLKYFSIDYSQYATKPQEELDSNSHLIRSKIQKINSTMDKMTCEEEEKKRCGRILKSMFILILETLKASKAIDFFKADLVFDILKTYLIWEFKKLDDYSFDMRDLGKLLTNEQLGKSLFNNDHKEHFKAYSQICELHFIVTSLTCQKILNDDSFLPVFFRNLQKYFGDTKIITVSQFSLFLNEGIESLNGVIPQPSDPGLKTKVEERADFLFKIMKDSLIESEKTAQNTSGETSSAPIKEQKPEEQPHTDPKVKDGEKDGAKGLPQRMGEPDQKPLHLFSDDLEMLKTLEKTYKSLLKQFEDKYESYVKVLGSKKTYLKDEKSKFLKFINGNVRLDYEQMITKDERIYEKSFIAYKILGHYITERYTWNGNIAPQPLNSENNKFNDGLNKFEEKNGQYFKEILSASVVNELKSHLQNYVSFEKFCRTYLNYQVSRLLKMNMDDKIFSLLFDEDNMIGDKGIFDQNTLSSAMTRFSNELWSSTCQIIKGEEPTIEGELAPTIKKLEPIFIERARHVIEWITKGTSLPLPSDSKTQFSDGLKILRELESDKIKAEEAEKARKEAEDKARLEAEEKARKEAEEKAKLETEKKARKEAEDKTRNEAEEKANLEAREKARKEAEEKANLEAREKARKEAEDKAKLETEEKARKEAEEKDRKEAEDKAKLETEEKARKETEEKSRKEAEDKAKQETEEKARTEEKDRKEAEDKAKLETEEKAKLEAEEKAKLEAEEKVTKDAEVDAQKSVDDKAKEKTKKLESDTQSNPNTQAHGNMEKIFLAITVVCIVLLIAGCLAYYFFIFKKKQAIPVPL
jgi:hypothetical protein